MTLDQALKHLASADTLLVVVDFDGTLAPIVEDPARARPATGSTEVLERIAALGDVSVAVLSGRTLADLRRLTGAPHGVILVGGHGAELDDASPQLSDETTVVLDKLTADLDQIVERFPGAKIERKPTGVAFHYRNVDSSEHAGAAAAALELTVPESLVMIHGKCVVEWTGSGIDKGDAIRQLRRRSAADGVLFVGDDVTDEHAFAALEPTDVGVKVGAGDTAAAYRVGGVDDVVRLLRLLSEVRRIASDEP